MSVSMEEIPLKGTAGLGAEQAGTKPKPAAAGGAGGGNDNDTNNHQHREGTEIEMMEQDLEMELLPLVGGDDVDEDCLG